ncbi:MAG TPA: MIP/aquaporin family protein [Burkholderiales bacterium]
MSVLSRKLAAEFVGTAMLLATVVGSGIMAERISGGNQGVALLANALATGAVLYALICAMGNISGAHFNPAVTLAAAWLGKLSWRAAACYLSTQIVAAFAGVAVAHWMFGLPAIFASQHERSGAAQAFSEAVATFGLVIVILNCARHKPDAIAMAVATYITAAYWFTASTSFANPAVTLARSLTDTFSGIRPIDVPAFIAAQLVGALVATTMHRKIFAE